VILNRICTAATDDSIAVTVLVTDGLPSCAQKGLVDTAIASPKPGE